jgi:hypothetical protein
MKKLFFCSVLLSFFMTSTFAQETASVKKATPVVNIKSADEAGNDKETKAACCKGKKAKDCAKHKDGKSCHGKETSSASANGSAAKPACCASKAAGKPGCHGSSQVDKKEEATPAK